MEKVTKWRVGVLVAFVCVAGLYLVFSRGMTTSRSPKPGTAYPPKQTKIVKVPPYATRPAASEDVTNAHSSATSDEEHDSGSLGMASQKPGWQDEEDRPDEATIWEQLVAELGEVKARKFLRLLESDKRNRDPDLYNREKIIEEAHWQILSGSSHGQGLEEYLDFLERGLPRVKREEILTIEFLAQLEAERVRRKQLQLDNIERLRNSPVPLLPPDDPRGMYAPDSPTAQWNQLYKRITLWGSTPLEPDVKAAIIAAFQDRLTRLNPAEAMRDYAFQYLLEAITGHCAKEARDLLKNYYHGCSDTFLRHRFLLAYAWTLPLAERADLYAQAMLSEPSDWARREAEKCFQDILKDCARSGTFWRPTDQDKEKQAIAAKYANYKSETFYGVVQTGDKGELLRVIDLLQPEIASEGAILKQLATTHADPEIRLAALGSLGSSDAMPPSERAAIYRELYQRKDADVDVREACIGALASSRHITDPQNRALIEAAMMGDPDEGIRKDAAGILEEYRKDLERFPSRDDK
jgi:hypothetical protein